MPSFQVPSVIANWWRKRRWTRWAIELVAAAWSLLLIAWLVLYWAILPHIEQWRPQIEARASQALGVPVRIGHIEVSSGGWVPAIDMRDVVLLDARQREALRLPRIAAAVSVRSLLTLRLRFEQLLIEQPQLDVRRDAQGRVHVAGLEIGGASSGTPSDAATDWLFDQGEFVIRGGTLRWTDELRQAQPLALSDVDIVMRNGLRRHALRIDATPPADWGERFSLMGQLHAPLLVDGNNWRRWSGTLYADLPRARLDDLRRYVDLPFQLNEGEGAVRAWLELAKGQPRQATVDVALREVSVRLAANVEPLAFEQVEGRLSGRRDDDEISIKADGFGFVTGDGLRWPRSDMALTLRQRRDGPRFALGLLASSGGDAASAPWNADVVGGSFGAERLDLSLMASVAERIPLPPGLRRLLGEADPQGVISGLHASWDGALDDLKHYRVKARLNGLAMAAKAMPEHDKPGRPGWRNADIDLQASEEGGHATLAIRDGALEFPGVFADGVVPLEKFDAQIAWGIRSRGDNVPPALEMTVRNARFVNADAQGELDAVWRTGEGEGVARGGRFPGRLEMTGKLSRGQAIRVARYLPLGIPDMPRDYVARAVRGGTISNATFRVKGDLWDFPYSGGKDGEFRIAGRCEDVTLAYVPGASSPSAGDEAGWDAARPEFTKVSGDLVFDRTSMEIHNARANLWGVTLSSVRGGIPDMGHHPVLSIDGQAQGPLADLLRYVNTTPIGTWTHQALVQAKGNGVADLKLALGLPLDKLEDTRVSGSVTLRGNDVHLRPDTPLMAGAKGRVDFTREGFSIVGGTARVFGGEAGFSGGSQADGAMRFTGQGIVTAEGMRRAAEMPWLPRIAASLSGQTPYRMTLNIVRGQPEFSVTSTLAGLGSELPAPLRKAPEASLPLRLQTSVLPPSEGSPVQDQLRFELGNVVQAQFVRDLSRDAAQVLRGGIGVFEPAPQPSRGVQAHLSLPHLNLDAWGALLPGGAGGNAGAGGGNAASANDGYMPSSLALRAQEVVIGSRTLTHVVAGASASDDPGRERLWRANAEADQLSGYFEYRPSRSQAFASGGRVYARLARLAIPKGEAEKVESLFDQPPSSVPSLDIVVDDFELRGKKLGRVEVEAVNRIAGEGREASREWRLSKFNVISPEAKLLATGQWASVAGSARKRMALDFKLELGDSGAYLERLLGERVLRGGKGMLQGQLSWMGSPMSLDYPSLAGDINVALERGQFLKAEPGAARLLGVLSLQSLPRRLALDFRDVFNEGFAFDNVSGDVKIAQGKASTNNLRMRGVQAAVLMEGQADIERETQDLRVVVVPEINAGTASLAYAAINPAVGLGTFLAQLLLRKPLVAAGTREFRVSGSWSDPKVERVERKPAEPSSDAESPTSKPSAS